MYPEFNWKGPGDEVNKAWPPCIESSPEKASPWSVAFCSGQWLLPTAGRWVSIHHCSAPVHCILGKTSLLYFQPWFWWRVHSHAWEVFSCRSQPKGDGAQKMAWGSMKTRRTVCQCHHLCKLWFKSAHMVGTDCRPHPRPNNAGSGQMRQAQHNLCITHVSYWTEWMTDTQVDGMLCNFHLDQKPP